MGAIAAVVTKKWDDGRMIHVLGTLAFSGAYVAAGDVLDFSGLEIPSAAVPALVQVNGRASGFKFNYVPGATQRLGKVKVMGQQPTDATAGIITLAEIAVAAYPAGITGDVNDFYAIFDKSSL